ncbi:hypothetical protein HY229_05995 [Candidatus Acetothermia bacterium]|nr:hypothetical protein [Candidatus Acetothermia bacterium]MBI3643633.1 hypothetical protein [Candidatus Acetothermia bacterium]
MAKRIGIVVGFIAVAGLLVLAWPNLGVGQLGAQSQNSAITDPAQLQMEIHMLKLVNEMGLTADQMKSLKDQITQIRASHDAVQQAQIELRDFLAGFNRTQDEYSTAIKPYDDKVTQAQGAFQKQLEASIAMVKNTLTMRQGEILQQHFQMMVPMMGMQMMHHMGMSDDPQIMGHFNGHMYIAPQSNEDSMNDFSKKMDMLGQKLGQLGEKLGSQMGQWFENWNGDPQVYVYKNKMGKGWTVQMPKPQGNFKVLGHPNIGMRLSSGNLSMIDLLLQHLNILEKVLDERLQKLTPPPSSSQSS